MQLGHASRATTDRYAHLAADDLDDVAAATVGPQSSHESPTVASKQDEKCVVSGGNDWAPPGGVEPPTNGLGNLGIVKQIHEVGSKKSHGVGRLEDRASAPTWGSFF